jgi:hypothetical protein
MPKSIAQERGSVQNDRDRMFVKQCLRNFDPATSEAWKFLENRFGPDIPKPWLISLGRVLAQHLNIPLAREYKRRKGMMIKWFDDHFEFIEPFINQHVEVLTET